MKTKKILFGLLSIVCFGFSALTITEIILLPSLSVILPTPFIIFAFELIVVAAILTEDIFEALDVQDELQTLYTSGTVFHCFLGERIPDWKACANLVKKIAENYKIPYYTMSPTYSVCRKHGYLVKKIKKSTKHNINNLNIILNSFKFF